MAEGRDTRSTTSFVLGFLLGTLVGGGGVAVLLSVFGAGEEPEVAVAHAPPVHPTPAVAAPAPVEPPPAPPPVEAEPEPAPVPAPAPAARKTAPAPKPAPAPAPPPKPSVSASKGPTNFVFVGKDGKRYTPDAVPPGDYEVRADWGNGLERSGTVTVREGKAVKLVCDPPTKTCTAK